MERSEQDYIVRAVAQKLGFNDKQTEELAEQAEFVDIMYSGTKVLDNGMNRFMVIGK